MKHPSDMMMTISGRNHHKNSAKIGGVMYATARKTCWLWSHTHLSQHAHYSISSNPSFPQEIGYIPECCGVYQILALYKCCQVKHSIKFCLTTSGVLGFLATPKLSQPQFAKHSTHSRIYTQINKRYSISHNVSSYVTHLSSYMSHHTPRVPSMHLGIGCIPYVHNVEIDRVTFQKPTHIVDIHPPLQDRDFVFSNQKPQFGWVVVFLASIRQNVRSSFCNERIGQTHLLVRSQFIKLSVIRKYNKATSCSESGQQMEKLQDAASWLSSGRLFLEYNWDVVKKTRRILYGYRNVMVCLFFILK